MYQPVEGSASKLVELFKHFFDMDNTRGKREPANRCLAGALHSLLPAWWHAVRSASYPDEALI